MTSVSITSMPGIDRGRSASVAGSVAGLVQARDLDDELHVCDASASRRSITPSQVIVRARARSRPRPVRRPGARSAARAAIASPSASGSGAVTRPFTPSTTNSVGPARVGRRDDRLAGEKRLERDVAVVLVVRRKDYAECARVQLDELVVVHFAEKLDASREAQRAARALRAPSARVPVPATSATGRPARAPSRESPGRRA